MHPTALSIQTKSNMFPKGSVDVTYTFANWTISVESIWGKRRNNIYLSANHCEHLVHKNSYHLTQTWIYRVLVRARSPNYNSRGSTNKITHLLLSSENSLHMLEAIKPSFALKKKKVAYSARLKGRDFKSLSNCFILFERLLEQIEAELPIVN